MRVASSEDGMKGGTVSMCVEKTTFGKSASGFRRPLRWRGVDVESAGFDRHLFCLVPEAAKFSPEIISYRGFVAGNRFDVDQLARERDGVHGGENSRGGTARKSEAVVSSQNAEVRPMTRDRCLFLTLHSYFIILTSDFISSALPV